MKIKDRVRLNREKKGLSTTDLARLTGISQSTISKLENGKRKADIEILRTIAEALEVSVERLTGEALSCIIDDRTKTMGITLEDISRKTGVSLYWLQQIDSFVPGQLGDPEIGYEWITRVAEVIGLPSAQLRAALARQEIPAYDGPQSSPEEDFTFRDNVVGESQVSYNIYPNSTKIPVLGSIPAGLAVEAVQDIIGWEEVPEEWFSGGREYFGLVVKGDSMYPEYLEGDTVIVRKQTCCDNKDDCVVMVDATDATLKRVKLCEDGLELLAVNKMYGKKKYTAKEVLELPVTILGVVVELRRKKK